MLAARPHVPCAVALRQNGQWRLSAPAARQPPTPQRHLLALASQPSHSHAAITTQQQPVRPLPASPLRRSHGTVQTEQQRQQRQQRRQQRCQPKASAADTAAPAASPTPAASQNAASALRLAMETLRPDWPLLLLTTVVLVATIAFTLCFPLVIGEVFDLVRANGGLAGEGAAAAINPFAGLAPATAGAPPTSFTAVMLKLSACLVLSATGNAMVSWCSSLLGERFGHRLRGWLMGTLMARDQAFFDAASKGDLLSRLTLDVTVLQNTLADFIGQRGFRSMFEVVGALAMIALQQPLLAFVTLFITPALSRLLRAVVVRSSAIIYQRQQVAAKALDFASERLSQVQTVQVFAQEERETGAFRDLSACGYDMAQRYAFFQGIVEGAGRLAVNVGTVALLGLGGMLVIQNRISVGALLAVNVFNLFISVGLSSVAASLGELGKAVGALERVAELVVPTAAAAPAADSANAVASSNSISSETRAAAPSHSSSGDSGEQALVAGISGVAARALEMPTPNSTNGSGSSGQGGQVEFRDVWFRYPGAEDWAVKNFSLTLLPGQTVALVGPSGGGKSTIAALLLGLYHPLQGTILVNGQPLDPEDQAGGSAAAVGMAAVLQQAMLMSGSVREQISYGKPDAAIEEVLEAASAAHADKFVRQLPNGYETEVGERGHALSGGQKQRLAIARALLLHPTILVLDEVTSSLDVTSERYISDTLRSLAATKLIIAHRLSTVRRADVIAVVAGGMVVEQGSHHDLLRLEGGIYQRLVNTADLGAFWVHSGASDSSGSDEEGGKQQQEPDAAAEAVPA